MIEIREAGGRVDVLRPGIYKMSEIAYHADRLHPYLPTLSRSDVHRIAEQSPRHAHAAHPRLTPDAAPEHGRAFDVGSRAHALVLGQEHLIAPVDAANWQTKGARQARDDARERGLIPTLPHEYEQADNMARACHRQLDQHEEAADVFLPNQGRAEQVVVAQIQGVWCRAMVDWLPDPGSPGAGIIYDYKTTSSTAHPSAWGKRTLYDSGAYLQDPHYSAVIEHGLGLQGWRVRWIVQETSPPYAISVIELGPEARAYAHAKWSSAVETWRHCLRTGRWPGYPSRVCYVEVPPWRTYEFEAEKAREELQREERERVAYQEHGDWDRPIAAG